jgi:L-seryl-tRNA(Ser) seleniumtransferase
MVQAALGGLYTVTASPMMSQIGSGALPVDQLPSYGFRVTGAAGKSGSVGMLEAELRELPRPILGRLADKSLWLDLRCLEAADEAEFIAQWIPLDR